MELQHKWLKYLADNFSVKTLSFRLQWRPKLRALTEKLFAKYFNHMYMRNEIEVIARRLPDIWRRKNPFLKTHSLSRSILGRHPKADEHRRCPNVQVILPEQNRGTSKVWCCTNVLYKLSRYSSSDESVHHVPHHIAVILCWPLNTATKSSRGHALPALPHHLLEKGFKRGWVMIIMIDHQYNTTLYHHEPWYF